MVFFFFQFCLTNGLNFLTVRVYIGIWLGIIGLVVVCFEGSVLVKLFTRFTEEIFAALISLLYIVESIMKLIVVSVIIWDLRVHLCTECIHLVHNREIMSLYIFCVRSLLFAKIKQFLQKCFFLLFLRCFHFMWVILQPVLSICSPFTFFSYLSFLKSVKFLWPVVAILISVFLFVIFLVSQAEPFCGSYLH